MCKQTLFTDQIRNLPKILLYNLYKQEKNILDSGDSKYHVADVILLHTSIFVLTASFRESYGAQIILKSIT